MKILFVVKNKSASIGFFHPDSEVDPIEIIRAFKRRWGWIAGGGLLGLTVGAISLLLASTSPQKHQDTFVLTVDISQGPCIWLNRKLFLLKDTNNPNSNVNVNANTLCPDELLTSRRDLYALASDKLANLKSIEFNVDIPSLGNKDGTITSSKSIIELTSKGVPSSSANLKSQMEEIQKQFTENQISKYKDLIDATVEDIDFADLSIAGEGWTSLQMAPQADISPESPFSLVPLVLGLMSGLVLGSGVSLVVDRWTDRVFCKDEIITRLGYPLWLTLPSLPWSDELVAPLIGQLTTYLDKSLDWRVLSIACMHEQVGPLAKLVIEQGEPGLRCEPGKPLLNSVIRLDISSRPIGLLIVVESGFNSAQALEYARLMLEQITYVQSVGVVLAGVPLPSERMPSGKAWQ